MSTKKTHKLLKDYFRKNIDKESDGKEIIKYVDELLKDNGYDYYYPSSVNIIDECIRLERNYMLNCSDFPKDYSVEGANRRWKYNMERLRKKYYGE